MKTIVTTCCALCLMAGVGFAKLSSDEIKRLGESATVLDELRNVPDNGIPQDLWNKAECAVVIPSLKKAAFIVGGEYGAGVMSCRKNGDWTSPVFMQLTKGSVGFQIGAQSTDLVLLIMNRRGLEKLLNDKVSLGADASVAAGPVGRTASAATDAQLSAEILSYSRSQGLFAGINLSGGVMKPDNDAQVRAYGPNVAASDVALGNKRVSLEQATAFLSALKRQTGAAAAN